MRNDSIVGTTGDGDVAAVASGDIRLFEVWRVSVLKTIGVLSLLNVLGGVVLRCAGDEDPFSVC